MGYLSARRSLARLHRREAADETIRQLRIEVSNLKAEKPVVTKDSRYGLTGDEDFDAMLDSCFKILKLKGADYTIGSVDRLANFKTVAQFTGLTKEQVFAVFFYKHVAAIFNYVKSAKQSESEPIEGRIADVINYSLLFGKMVAEDKRALADVEPRQ